MYSKIGPEKELPYPQIHDSSEAYIQALLSFLTTSDLLQNLCGGVHILDFLIREPDLYESLLPPDWRVWLEKVAISEFLDLLMREDLECISQPAPGQKNEQSQEPFTESISPWRNHCQPPRSLLAYIKQIRNLTLDRTFYPRHGLKSESGQKLSRQIRVGMNVKKAHEVENFAAFVDDLTSRIADSTPYRISHLVDFGSGQNYLGRTLASPMYQRNVIAVERKHRNIDGAKLMDINANLVKKPMVLRNKKAFRSGKPGDATYRPDRLIETMDDVSSVARSHSDRSPHPLTFEGTKELRLRAGTIQYLEHEIADGNLAKVSEMLGTGQVHPPSRDEAAVEHEKFSSAKTENTMNEEQSAKSLVDSQSPAISDLHQLMVISLHSCGNLLHHGLRSIVINPSVKAVAMIGCCYNLVTERLGPPTYKIPSLRLSNERLQKLSSECDPHGFPMSERLAHLNLSESSSGLRFNITARMMAVQAPLNWSEADSESFFTRHFYRALLQRILVDQGLVPRPENDGAASNVSPRGWSGDGEPFIIGSLQKACYRSFVAYIRGAVEKISQDPVRGAQVKFKLGGMTDEEIMAYERRYQSRKHHLSLVWSLMAFSAGVVESAIIVDRWLYLKEQPEIRECWVQAVFDHAQSPRNMVVVGIKQ